MKCSIAGIDTRVCAFIHRDAVEALVGSLGIRVNPDGRVDVAVFADGQVQGLTAADARRIDVDAHRPRRALTRVGARYAAMRAGGSSVAQIADACGISPAAVYRALARHNGNASVDAEVVTP